MENMKNNVTNRRVESSLLLQPGSLMTWDNTSGNSFFMPLAVDSHDANMLNKNAQEERKSDASTSRINEPLFTPSTSAEQYAMDARSISQLQQPLMPCKSIPTAPSTVKMSTSFVAPEEKPVNLYSPSVQCPATCSSFPSSPTYPTSNPVPDPYNSSCPPTSHLPFNSSGPPTIANLHDNPGNAVPLSKNLAFSENDYFERNADLSSQIFVCHAVQPYWFYKEVVEHKELWYGFSPMDSEAIEKAHQSSLNKNAYETTIVPVVGGRYDVHVQQREKVALYWNEKAASVRRCTWFYKIEGSQRFIPYDEAAAYAIEEMYQKCASTRQWHQKVLLNGGEVVIMEGPHTILHYEHGLDAWPTVVDVKATPKIAVRGVPDGSVILPNETMQIDHLVFVVQGIGSFCDLSFRTVYQCVDGFRDIANNLIPTHFKQEYDNNIVGRIEFLPLAWHASLHTDDVGFDRKMKSITLPSIPKLRYFTNDTLLDILLYSSPMYCQAIIDTVTSNLNRLYNLFLSRNPQFLGNVSVAGHSLGSLILFDILSNQTPMQQSLDNVGYTELHDVNLSNCNGSRRSSMGTMSNSEAEKQSAETIESAFEKLGLEDYLEMFLNEKIDLEALMFCGEAELKDLGLPMGPRKKLLAFIMKRELPEQSEKKIELVDGATDPRTPEALLANPTPYFSPAVYPYKSPYNALSSVTFPRLEFSPSCFFALGSPIAMFLAVRGYSTISEDFCFPTCPSFFHIFHPYDPVAFRIEPLIDPKFCVKPVLIPHHKGRKRMHLEIRESIVKMGSELKQKLFETLKFTWDHINLFTKGGNISTEAVEAEVDKLVQEQIRNQIEEDYLEFSENTFVGQLNRRRRIDFVLQEKPIEALNEYIFALTSHATYWNSEDTLLMILKELYAAQGISPKPSESKESVIQDLPLSQDSSPAFAQAENFRVNSYLSSASNMQPIASLQSPLINSGDLTNEALLPAGNTLVYNPSQSSIPASHSLGPPPLSGFVKKSPFGK